MVSAGLLAARRRPLRLSIRLGQLTADSEFFISDYGATFINGTFGWPAIMGMNVPNGGPAYPMGAPGVRVAISPSSGSPSRAPSSRATSSRRT